jgi:plastocyanin
MLAASRFAVAAVAVLTVLAAACSDDEGNTSGGGTSEIPAGGAGGATTTTTTPPAGSGGSVPFEPAHGCTEDGLTDLTGNDQVTIGFGFMDPLSVYEPRCVKIDAGTLVTFESFDGSTFSIHPLVGGVTPVADPESPFQLFVESSMSNAYSLASKGNYPFYCVSHAAEGMTGTIYVD